jgi:hypothetical protein
MQAGRTGRWVRLRVNLDRASPRLVVPLLVASQTLAAAYAGFLQTGAAEGRNKEHRGGEC